MPLTAAVSEAMSASMARSPRASITAMPWSPMVPESSTRSPGRTGANARSSGMMPTPAVVTNRPSAAPRGTTLVSPVTTRTPAASAASAMSATIARSSAIGKPSSSTNAAESQRGTAPAMARSFTVPCTARWPIEPPGKRRGCTTNESVDIASLPAGSGEHGAVAELVAERLHEHRVHERGRGLAARAVRERDDLVLEPRADGGGTRRSGR